jgi:hypothetical protein
LVAVATSTAFFRCARFFMMEDVESLAMRAKGEGLKEEDETGIAMNRI